jgi:CPA2 family monovalent cation:H+ antiporter-2
MADPVLHNDLVDILSSCLLVFGVAGFIVPIFNRLHISPVLGFLICGVILSPHALGLISGSLGAFGNIVTMDKDTVTLLGELGIIALLFMIGLELSFEKLMEMKRYIFGLGSAQIVVTGCVITAIAFAFDNSLQASIVIGTGFALSSTAIIMQLQKDYNLSRRAIGRMSFSILLMQDMAIVPILILIGTFASVSGEAGNTAFMVFKALGLAVACIVVIYVLGKKILQPALHSIAGTNKDEWIAAFTLFALCGITLITLKAGLSPALGAFLAGLLIAETEFCEKIERILYPLKTILLGVFFISIGMKVNIAEVLDNMILLLLSVGGIFLVKGLTLYPVARVFGVKPTYARDLAMILSQPGEFTLMVISVSIAAGLLPANDGQFFLLVTVLGMLITPLLFRSVPIVREEMSKTSEGERN